LDQGVAAWPMPGRDRGFLHAVGELYASPLGPSEPWNASLPAALAATRGRPALEVIAAELDRLGVPAGRQEECIAASLLALRGWAGMFRHFEERPDRVPVAAVPARLADFLAVRLVCDRVAAEWIAARHGASRDLAAWWTELCDRYPARQPPGTVARAFLFWQVAGIVGLSAADIRALDENEIIRFESAIAGFDGFTRRRLFHLAYERRYRHEVLDALESHAEVAAPLRAIPRVQAIFCMDERCESLRRHLEEQGPAFETFGTAGFFAVPMYYRGLDDWHATPLCPIVMRPRHTVVEVPEADAVDQHRRWQAVRRQIGHLRGGVSTGSRELFRGGLLTAVVGAVAAVPLVARVAFPWLTSKLSQRTAGLVRGAIATRLVLEHEAEPPLPDGTQAGFDVDEMAGIVRRVLEDIGLTTGFARLVAVMGHGSTSLNNPHESAYDCGACGGGRGGPNARAFATMANDPRVRARLAVDGLVIPETTRFVGGMHDTCSDAITWHDTAALPQCLADDFAALRAACDRARMLDALERCRRFDSVPAGVGAAEALRRVEARAGDLAQVRPEYGHATNAVCVIGRRWRTRGLFLDRRAFLVSYDPESDASGEILARTLAAVGPVGAGINLAYLFSCVDPRGYGCGTKLPHNITGLIGVMDGHASDLRTGLPWQTVEIHEPVRLLLVIDAPQERIAAALERVPAVGRLVANRWVQLAGWDPAGEELRMLEQGMFVRPLRERRVMPVVEQSTAWFAGQRGHLAPARVQAGLVKAGDR
ncbi:MAG: putative inorganic carbon transporter subunit DabA, partial [Planctomycetia bacterium]